MLRNFAQTGCQLEVTYVKLKRATGKCYGDIMDSLTHFAKQNFLRLNIHVLINLISSVI